MGPSAEGRGPESPRAKAETRQLGLKYNQHMLISLAYTSSGFVAPTYVAAAHGSYRISLHGFHPRCDSNPPVRFLGTQCSNPPTRQSIHRLASRCGCGPLHHPIALNSIAPTSRHVHLNIALPLQISCKRAPHRSASHRSTPFHIAPIRIAPHHRTALHRSYELRMSRSVS